jgi:hypothetical protein
VLVVNYVIYPRNMLTTNYIDNIKRIYRHLLSWILCCYHHPFINPIVNPADILPVRGIPKLVIANQETVAAAWLLSPKPGICIIIAFESVVIVPSDTA